MKFIQIKTGAKTPGESKKIGQEGILPSRMKFIQLIRGKKWADLCQGKVCLRAN
jgi:hypothetical protein